MEMGSSRPLENELQQQKSSHDEHLDLFFEIQKRDRERKNATEMYDTGAGAAVHAHSYEYINSSEGIPLTAGSTLEAQVAARLASSSFYRTSKPIMRYASKRNNADLLTFDVGKTDYDWLMTPPATPFHNSIDFSNDATLENSNLPLQLHALATVEEVGLKISTQRPETSVFHNSPQLDKTSSSNFVATTNSDHMSLSGEDSINNHAKLAISSNSSNNTAKIIQTTDGNVNRSYTIANKKPLSNSEAKASMQVNSSGSSIKSSAKGYSNHENSGPVSKESLRITNPTSKFSELPSIITATKTTSHRYKSTTVGSTSSASTTPRSDTTSNAKRPTVTNAPSRKPTTPTLSQNKSKPIANDGGGGTRSTSIGRGAINISSNTPASRTTNKLGKGLRSTSSSRAGSPEATHTLPWEPSEMPGFSIEAPPNLRTEVSDRSTSTTRSSRSTSTTRSARSTSTTRSSRQPTTPTNHNNNNNSTSRDTSRSTSASKVRSTSTSKSSDTKYKTDSMNAITSTTLRGKNNKGASNSNVLGSRMVDKVIQARRAASSSSSLHLSASASPSTSSLPLSTSLSSSSPPLPAASSSLSSFSLKSTSSLSISSTTSLSSLSSTLSSSSSSSFSSPPASSTLPSSHNTQARSNEPRSVLSESNSRLRQNKVHSPSNMASVSTSLFKDTNPGFNSSRLNQSSKTRPMQRNADVHSEMIMPRTSEVRAKPLKQVEDAQRNVGTLRVDNTMNYPGQSNVGNAESRDVSKKPTTTIAKEVEKQHQHQNHHHQQQQQQQHHHQISEESSDFSNELNAIMRQDIIHHQYCAFPSKDILKVSNNVGNGENRNISKKPNSSIAKEVHQNQQQQYQMTEESSDFSNELNAIMRQDKAHYRGVFPSKDIIKVSNNWMLNSPDCSMRDDSVELMHLFRQGIERYEISESPLVCQHGAPGNCDKCNNVHGKGFKSTAEVWKASPLSNNSRFSHKHPNELWKGSPFQS